MVTPKGSVREADPGRMEGMVIKIVSDFFTVRSSSGSLECRRRRRLDLYGDGGGIMVGDRVRVLELGVGKGMIEERFPRRNGLRRPRIANVDRAVVVGSFGTPAPDFFSIDRILVQVETEGLEAVVCLNKADLAAPGETDAARMIYSATGYPVVITSAKSGEGLEALREALRDSITVLAGPSGVGKSTMLNALLPGVALRMGEVSLKRGTGRHTTRHVELLPMADGSWVADTPGFQQLDLSFIDPVELASFFPDLAPYRSECRFSRDCVHDREPGCRVKEAVEAGEVSRERYDSYLRLLREIRERFQPWK